MTQEAHGPGIDGPGRVKIRKDPYSVLMVALLSALVVISILGILNRNLGWDLAWTSEVVTGISIWLTFIGVAMALMDGLHVKMSLLVSKFSARGKRIYGIVMDIVWAAFFAMLLVAGTLAVLNSIELGATTPTLHLPTFVFESAIPLGGLFGVIVILSRIRNLGVAEVKLLEEGGHA